MMRTRTVLRVIAFCAVIGAAALAYSGMRSAEGAAAGAQDPIQLDRRISMLEQRLYSIESRISSVEQQVIVAQRSTPSQAGRDPLVDLLRSEVEALKIRIREIECGLVHVDERTLPAAEKDARKRAGARPSDPCRLDPETPVKLSTRP